MIASRYFFINQQRTVHKSWWSDVQNYLLAAGILPVKYVLFDL